MTPFSPTLDPHLPHTGSTPLPHRIRPAQIFRIRETHEELSKLLRSDEAQSLGIGEVFVPFARVPALQVGWGWLGVARLGWASGGVPGKCFPHTQGHTPFPPLPCR